MKNFTNLFGIKVQLKPFFQSSLNTWRIARFENEELQSVNEKRRFNTFKECLIECNN
tara:strand:+ start:596 stop:766 length:171 start_codon:yes stop_codon:yes gene_type:complete